LLTIAINAVYACQTSTTTSTRDSAGVNSIVVTSEGSLTVSLEEAEAFQALATFNGWVIFQISKKNKCTLVNYGHTYITTKKISTKSYPSLY
jgi:hypothetical protein